MAAQSPRILQARHSKSIAYESDTISTRYEAEGKGEWKKEVVMTILLEINSYIPQENQTHIAQNLTKQLGEQQQLDLGTWINVEKH